MRFAVAYSKQNIAGKNIAEDLKKYFFLPQVPIIELKKETLYSDLSVKSHPELNNVDFIVFASTHRSEKGNPSLSLHAPGNWRGADLGGKPGNVCPTSCYVLKYLFKNLEKISRKYPAIKEKYTVTLEVTHHGPLTTIPCCFIEVGSNEKEWNDRLATKVIAETIATLNDYDNGSHDSWIPTIGIGGPHYCPNFNKIQLYSQYAISHIIPNYVMPFSESMIHEAEQKTIEQVSVVLLDWKGCGRSDERSSMIKMVEDNGLKIKRTSDVEK